MSLEVKHVFYTYQEGSPTESHALQDICLTVNEGEFLGIVGHTGSGKSTLIQHLNGLLKPNRGDVLVDGLNINQKEAKGKLKELRMKVGIVFQYPEYQLFEETVEQDIAFGPRNLGLKRCRNTAAGTRCYGIVKIGLRESTEAISVRFEWWSEA